MHKNLRIENMMFIIIASYFERKTQFGLRKQTGTIRMLLKLINYLIGRMMVVIAHVFQRRPSHRIKKIM